MNVSDGQPISEADLEVPETEATGSEFLEKQSYMEELGIANTRQDKGRLSVAAVSRQGSYLRRLSNVVEVDISALTNGRLPPLAITEESSNESF